MIEELARHHCRADNGTLLFVVERCNVFTTHGEAGASQHRGAAWLTLLDGEPVRYVDARTFEVVATGELIAHDPVTCNCAPAAKVVTHDGSHEDGATST